MDQPWIEKYRPRLVTYRIMDNDVVDRDCWK